MTKRTFRPPFVRSAHNYDMDAASRLSGLSCSDPSRTDQSFKDECDINTIVRNFGVTGELPLSSATPMQGDFTNVVDYQSALNLIIRADEAFSELSAAVRRRFDNDPAKFLDFASDPANLEQMREMGLTRPETPPAAPLKVQVIPEPTQTSIDGLEPSKAK